MTRTRLKSFPGGLHPNDSKLATASLPIEDCPLPEEFVVPLAQHIGAPAEPCVQIGQTVLKGEAIATAKGFVSAPVHAPTSGEVLAVEPRPHASGRMLPAVVIRANGRETWSPSLAGVDGDPLTLPATELRERIWQAGLVGLGGATFPVHVKLSPPDEMNIDTLIINGVECEPYLTADHRLMLEAPQRILEGIRILRHLLKIELVYVGIEANKPDAIALLTPLLAKHGVEVVPLAVKYPQGAEKQLILACTGREVPSGGLPMAAGVVVQNVATVAAVAEAIYAGRPLIERICTVAGPGVATPKNLRIRIGTPLSHLVEACGGLTCEPEKIIMGGPMMGNTQLNLDAPAMKGTSGLLIFGPGQLPTRPEGPCIRCARCVQACPARLLPTTIAAYSRLDRFDDAENYGAMDCIECGCCSYACPAAIPLVQALRQAKGAILEKRRRG